MNAGGNMVTHATTPSWRRWALRAMALTLVVLALLPLGSNDDPPAAADDVAENASTAGTAGSQQGADSGDQVADAADPTNPEPAGSDNSGDGTIDTGIDRGTADAVDPVGDEPSESQTNTIEGFDAQLETAITNVNERFDVSLHLPGWTIEPAAPNPAAASFTQPETKQIFVTENPSSSVEELEIAVLHSLGHAVDVTWMDADKRDAFRLFRNHNPALDWRETDNSTVTNEDPLNSAEDFAEVFIAWVLAGNYSTTTTAIADSPSVFDVIAFCEIVDIEGITC